MGSLTEKVAIVTGASAGIGRSIAERLARDGATVVVNYGKSADKAKAVVAGIVSRGGKGGAVQGGMGKGAGASRPGHGPGEKIGRVENFGEKAREIPQKAIGDTTEQEFD